MSESATVTVTRSVTAAAGVYAPGHIGELTQYLPFELVDDVLSEPCSTGVIRECLVLGASGCGCGGWRG